MKWVTGIGSVVGVAVGPELVASTSRSKPRNPRHLDRIEGGSGAGHCRFSFCMNRDERFLDGNGSFRLVLLVTFGLAFRICFLDWIVKNLKAGVTL